jgi:hypothetical protein
LEHIIVLNVGNNLINYISIIYYYFAGWQAFI